MNNSSLNYIINVNGKEKELYLESLPLYELDNYTSNYPNENEFIKKYSGKDKIEKFLKENKVGKGNLVIKYTKSQKNKAILPILYNSKEKIEFAENPFEGKITEIEKARKLLFNSKNQLFVKLVLESKLLNKLCNNQISITYKEKLVALDNGLDVIEKDDETYIDFFELFRYRYYMEKLGTLRNVYEDMLQIIKNKIYDSNDEDFYYYSRQFKILINKYNELISKNTIKNLSFKKINIKNKYVLNTGNL